MNTIRCNFCRQMYSYDGLPPEACPQCRSRREAQYQQVRELVKDNPGITAMEVHEITEVPLLTIARYIETGRLEVASAHRQNMDTVDMQIWVDNSRKKGQATKAKMENQKTAAAPPPDEVLDDIDDKDTDTKRKPKQRINFIVK